MVLYSKGNIFTNYEERIFKRKHVKQCNVGELLNMLCNTIDTICNTNRYAGINDLEFGILSL